MLGDVNDHDIQRLIAGDRYAFEKIYDLYHGKVYRVAFRFLKDEVQSEEIVQETFINLWVNRAKLDPNSNIWLFLFVASKRLSLNALRNTITAKSHLENLFVHFNESSNSVEETVFAHDLGALAEKVIADLPSQQQTVFKLSRIEGHSHKEIADHLNISTNTVKNHMGTALKTIKSKLTDYGFLCVLFFFSK
jgi:RNA polymerase sigma-70 factor (ECF subfamily)